MIILKIFGGLGNQMFQFAFGLPFIIAEKHLKLDISSFETKKAHNGFELSKVFKHIDLPIAKLRDAFYFIEKFEDEHGSSSYRLQKHKQIVKESKEIEFNFLEDVYELNDTYFEGYWQNHSYFNSLRKELLYYFQFPPIEKEDTINYLTAQSILASDSVSVHIRRGDYLKSAYHTQIGMEYYKKAFQIAKDKVSDPHFFVFSDDIKWAKENICESNVTFIDNNTVENSFRDMQLMSLCKNNIITNSTFSWWSAWLNDNNQKIVISPKKWFADQINMHGLLFEEWIKL
jgi:hypothetical protein